MNSSISQFTLNSIKNNSLKLILCIFDETILIALGNVLTNTYLYVRINARKCKSYNVFLISDHANI